MEHSITLPIRWGDMDAFGHLNNVAIFRLLEECRIQWLSALECPIDIQETGPVVINVSCDFLKQVVYPADINIITRVENIGRSSLEISHELYIAGDKPQLCGRASGKMVWVHYQDEVSVPLPAELRTRLTTP
ncbi:MAG: acyl-CoA thioesterase [Motiliproteus sp.]|nr:acyl-CoA thioesterase [Motiliproteus sp.]MCW9051187.1 acyl-CoA thioesterase [Motiliproteus sp.]